MNKNIVAVIFALAIIGASFILGNAYIKRTDPDGTISVTGLGKKDFSSDLIVWEGSFNTVNKELKEAYSKLSSDKETVASYLKEKGIPEDKIVFSAVNSFEKNVSKYTPDGRYVGEQFVGYQLTQTVNIESKSVEQIEKLSREITELLNKGVQFYSSPPRYYYTQLADLKIEMISKATEDARIRAEQIANNSGGQLGELVTAKMGVFQITGQNSNESYSWGGAYNTESKEKTASITMRLIYKVK